jgi:uncharacterized membrane protein YfhO
MKFFSKQTGGVLLFLLLIIVLFQKSFSVVDTILGRTILVILLLSITTLHRLLSIFAIALIIFVFMRVERIEGMQTKCKGQQQASGFLAYEGFALTDKEDTIRRGKSSKSIHNITHADKNTSNVLPFDGSLYSKASTL